MVQGIELSRRFYADLVAPWLAREFPGLRHAAALVGYGSELLGFDDRMSQDHNFGPRLQIFVGDDDFASASAIVARFAEFMPATFLGLPMKVSNTPPYRTGAAGDERHGVEVWTVSQAVAYWLGGVEPVSAQDWLGLAEQRLLALTAGAVFHDDAGELTALRRRLAWLPRDVWLYKLASQWRRIAEEQAFVGRAGFAGDDLGSRIIAARLARDVMRLAFLIEGCYAPYPKWFGSAFSRLACAHQLSPVLAQVLAADDWKSREALLAEVYLAVGRLQIAMGIPGARAPTIGPYHGRPFSVINADEIASRIREQIADGQLRALPLVGSLDQVTDATPVVEAPSNARAAIRAFFDAGD
jgi:hypothetical protein